MEIKIEKKDLLSGINIVSKAVGNNSTMPILSCILLSASDNGLRLTGNNLELCIQTSVINADVQQSGVVALEARLFFEIVKKLPDDYIQITVDDNYAVKIRYGKNKLNIRGSDPTDFPTIPDVKRNSNFSIKSNILRDMIRQTIFAIAEVNTKPVFTGELIKVEDGKVNIVAVDGFRIAHRYSEIDSAERSDEAIVPGKSMGEIAKLLAGSDGDEVTIYFTDFHILFELSTCTVVSSRLNGKFLDYQKSFYDDHTTIVKINRENLLSSLERASLIGDENGKKIHANFNIENDAIIITATTKIGTAHEVVSAEIDGEHLNISFNAKLLIDSLKAIEDEKIILQFKGTLSACIIRPVEEGDYKYLVLPIRPK